MNTEIMLSFIVAFIMSSLLVPIVKKIGIELDIIAHVNNRTIHKGKMVRIGGYAVYISFILCAFYFLKTDRQINSILISSFLIFLVGLYDDMNDLKPKTKVAVELLAATIVIFYGKIGLQGIVIPNMPSFVGNTISIIITYGWIIGITNALNLIDGLDGLCAGIAVIVLATISLNSLHFGRTDIAALSLLLAGSTSGFLMYNFHPASIFLGDCGALFLGFMISVISLLGFGYKSSAFFTLGAPIIVLAVPIMDTLIAIIRRKVNHKKFSEADRGHLHHQLMFNLKLGHRGSVLILYIATFLFSMASYLYLYDKVLAIILFIILMICFEIFVEYTEMISRKYRPILTFVNIFVRSDKLPVLSSMENDLKIAEEIKKDNQQKQEYFQYRAKLHERAKRIMKKDKKKQTIITCAVLGVLVAVCSIIAFVVTENKKEPVTPDPMVENVTEYILSKNPTAKLQETYDLLVAANEEGNQEKEISYAAAYFATDFFTWSNKTEREDIGGISYVLKNVRQNFASFALRDYYSDFVEHEKKYTASGLPEVSDYVINSVKPSDLKLEIEGFETAQCYDVELNLTYVNKPKGMATNSLKSSVLITLVEDNGLFYVVGVDYKDA